MKFKKACFYVFLFAIVLLNLGILYATNKNSERLNKYFRLHVVANSDSIEDQMLKLKLSKTIEEYIDTITKECKTKNESKDIITKNIYTIISLSKNIIKENGYDYMVKAYIGNIKYDLKSYNEFKFDEGIYDSLKIVIGEGKGTNWWSLIYPNSIDFNEYEESDISFSFKIIEILKDIFTKEEGTNPSSLII